MSGGLIAINNDLVGVLGGAVNIKYALIILLLLLSINCGGSSGGGSSSSSSGDSSTETGTVTGTVSIADGITLALMADSPLYAQDKSGIVVSVDDDESLSGTTDSDGNFTIENVPSGEKCIHASQQAISNETYGFRECMTVASGTNAVGALVMDANGSLSGNVTLEGETDYEGTLIYAAGTSYNAYTASNGDFTISDLLHGTYDVTIRRDGFTTVKYTSVEVASGTDTDMGTVAMVTGSGISTTGSTDSGSSSDSGSASTSTVGSGISSNGEGQMGVEVIEVSGYTPDGERTFKGDLERDSAQESSGHSCNSALPTFLSVYSHVADDSVDFNDISGNLVWVATDNQDGTFSFLPEVLNVEGGVVEDLDCSCDVSSTNNVISNLQCNCVYLYTGGDTCEMVYAIP